MDSIEIILATIQSMKKSAEIKLELKKKVKTINPNDIFIAGIIVTHGETLYTKNVKDFFQIEDLKIEQY